MLYTYMKLLVLVFYKKQTVYQCNVCCLIITPLIFSKYFIFFLAHIILSDVYTFLLLNIRATLSILSFFCPEIWKRKLRLQNKGICFRFAALLGTFLHFFGKLGLCYDLLWYCRLGQELLTAYWFAWNPSATSVSQLLDAVVVMNACRHPITATTQLPRGGEKNNNKKNPLCTKSSHYIKP